MYRADWSEKANAKVYRSLVLEQWRTHLAGSTNASGHYAARGFQGDYVIAIERSGKKVEQAFSLRAGESSPAVTVALP
jgi:hypothetical protein